MNFSTMTTDKLDLKRMFKEGSVWENFMISTVCTYPLGMYETMIKYKDEWLKYQARYSNLDTAVAGHHKAIEMVMNGDFEQDITALTLGANSYKSRARSNSMEENICDQCDEEVEYINDDGLCEECENEAGINRMECLNDRD